MTASIQKETATGVTVTLDSLGNIVRTKLTTAMNCSVIMVEPAHRLEEEQHVSVPLNMQVGHREFNLVSTSLIAMNLSQLCSPPPTTDMMTFSNIMPH